MSEERRGVILYGPEGDLVARALHEVDPRYVVAEHVVGMPGQVTVVLCDRAAQAHAVREAAPEVDWLVVELFRPEIGIEPVADSVLLLNIAKVIPRLAARAIDQVDLVTWYEVNAPVRADTVDGHPIAKDYSNVAITVPDGHRTVGHAVRTGGEAPDCLRPDADVVLPSHDLWALGTMRGIELCQVCTARYG